MSAPDYKADNDWLRNEMATNMIYNKEANELRAEIERLNGVNTVLCNRYAEIKTDNEWLRSALQGIADYPHGDTAAQLLRGYARRALEDKP